MVGGAKKSTKKQWKNTQSKIRGTITGTHSTKTVCRVPWGLVSCVFNLPPSCEFPLYPSYLKCPCKSSYARSTAVKPIKLIENVGKQNDYIISISNCSVYSFYFVVQPCLNWLCTYSAVFTHRPVTRNDGFTPRTCAAVASQSLLPECEMQCHTPLACDHSENNNKQRMNQTILCYLRLVSCVG